VRYSAAFKSSVMTAFTPMPVRVARHYSLIYRRYRSVEDQIVLPASTERP
jgi:hypothetical protein